MMNKRPSPTSMGNKFHCFEEAGFPMSACVLRLFSHVPMSLTLCDPMGCSLPGSSVHGVLQARILEWVATSSSRGSSQPRNRTRVSCLLHWQVGLYHWRQLGNPGSLIYLSIKRSILKLVGVNALLFLEPSQVQ